MKNKSILIAAVILGCFGLIGTTLVTLTEQGTRAQIIENERQALLKQLGQLVPIDAIDNNLLEHPHWINLKEILGEERSRLYFGTTAGNLYAIIYEVTAPNGYAGPIKLLVAARQDASISGVRVVSHHETPGLGDKIELLRSDWILGFNDKSLDNPRPERWKVKKDGGDFDQLTGATITPRAIVGAVKKVLQLHQQQGKTLFADYLKSIEKSNANE